MLLRSACDGISIHAQFATIMSMTAVCMLVQKYTEQSLEFIKRVSEMSGLGEATFAPEGMHA